MPILGGLLKLIISLPALGAVLLCAFVSGELSAQQVATDAGFRLTVSSANERTLRRGWRALQVNEEDTALAVIAELEAQTGANSLLLNEAKLLQSRFWLEDHPDQAKRSYQQVVAWVEAHKSSAKISAEFRRRLFEMGHLVYISTNDAYGTARLWIEATEWLPDFEQKQAVEIIWEALQNAPYHLITNELTPHQDEMSELDASGQLVSEPSTVPAPDSSSLSDETNATSTLLPNRRLNQTKSPLSVSTQGWFELASAAYFYLSAGQLYQIWQDWQTKWPDHIASQHPPKQLKSLPKMLAKQPKRVAVFLPLSGKLASAGISIQEGIIASYFNTPPPYRFSYSFFDTAGRQSLRDLYNQAIKEGAKLIVGPLAKQALVEIAKFAKRTVPILGLNYLPGGVRRRVPAAMYQFGLAATDEQQQIISRVLREAGRRILIVRSSDDWGVKNATLLAAAWREAGGEVVSEVVIDRPQVAVTKMAGALGINLSNQRAGNVRKVFRNKLEFQARRRHDMDAIILVTEPEIARAVKPALAYYFADNLPVYAFGKSIPTDSLFHPDLSGVRYCDLPWRIYSHETKSLLEQFRPASKGISYSFYAFGVDIAGLLTRLSTWQIDDGEVLNGTTGRLQISEQRIIRREMVWAEIVDGISRPLDDVGYLQAEVEQL